jgi:hypothetical protein
MSIETIGRHTVVTRVSNAEAAATSDITSTAVDMSLYDNVAFVVTFGTITASAVTSVKVQGSHDNSNWADLEGTAITVADDDDNQVFVAEVLQPAHRYVRCIVDRGTQNAVVDGIIAIQHGIRYLPVTQPATTTVEVNFAPGVGTA